MGRHPSQAFFEAASNVFFTASPWRWLTSRNGIRVCAPSFFFSICLYLGADIDRVPFRARRIVFGERASCRQLYYRDPALSRLDFASTHCENKIKSNTISPTHCLLSHFVVRLLLGLAWPGGVRMRALERIDAMAQAPHSGNRNVRLETE